MEAKQKRLLFILILALLFWTTDGYHQMSPAWVALGASVLCLLPKLGVLSGKALANLDFSQVIFVAGIIGLGGIASYSGAGAYIAEIIIRIMPMDKVGNFATFYLVVKKSNHLNRLVTLSPLTDMARNFHLRNGAIELQVNKETQNFEYEI